MKNNHYDNEKLKAFYEALNMNEIFKDVESEEEKYENTPQDFLEGQSTISSDSIEISPGSSVSFNNSTITNSSSSPIILDKIGNINITYPTQESWTEREQKKPNKSTAKEQIIKHHDTSFEYNESDTLEVKLFKALINQDQETVSNLKNLSELDEVVKKTAIGICVNYAASSRDIKLIEFLIENKIDVNNSYVTTEKGELHVIPLKLSIITDDCNATFFDEELVQLFLDNGTDINAKTDDGDRCSNTVYAELIEQAPEEFLLNLLDKVSNVNETELENISQNKTEKEYVVNNSYLGVAFEAKKHNLVKALVAKGADVNFANHYGLTILDDAVATGNFEMCEFLIENGADINHIDKKSCSTLVKMAQRLNCMSNPNEFLEEFIEHILKYADLNLKTNSGTVFSEIINYVPEDVAIKLLENVEDLDVMTTPLPSFHYTWNLETNIHKEEQYQPTPECYLTIAINNKKFKLAEMLIHKGANIDIETEKGNLLWDIIHQAIQGAKFNQYAELVTLLIDKGLDVNSLNKNKDSLLNFILVNNVADDIGLLKLLVDKGANVKFVAKNGNTLLLDAIYSNPNNKNFEAIKYLIENGANLKSLNDYNRSSLESIIGYNNQNYKVVKFLVEKNMTNVVDDNGKSLLFCAVSNNYENQHTEIIKYLIENGSNINLCNNDGLSIW